MAPRKNTTDSALPDIGSPAPWPWPPLEDEADATGLAAGLATGAGTFGAGAGQVMLPSLITVSPRMASSSMLTLMTPSLVLHSSSARRNRLVAYRVDDCLASREARSV